MADRQVVAYVGKDGDMGMHVHDLKGPPGRDEYEYYTWVKKKHRDKLIISLMEKLYGGNDSCPEEFQSLIEQNGIPCERYVI